MIKPWVAFLTDCLMLSSSVSNKGWYRGCHQLGKIIVPKRRVFKNGQIVNMANQGWIVILTAAHTVKDTPGNGAELVSRTLHRIDASDASDLRRILGHVIHERRDR